MRVLVTGGLGVNGAWVARELLASGHQPILFDNRDDRGLVQDIIGRVEIEMGDLSDSDQVRRVFTKTRPDRIIHLAAVVKPDKMPEPAVHVNVCGVATVCRAALEVGVDRVVYTSSKAVYGAVTGEFGHPHYRPLGEAHPVAPTRLYDITKYTGELVGRWFAQYAGLHFTTLRFASIYGPGKLQRYGEGPLYCSLIESAIKGLRFEVERGGEQRNDAIYIVDAARAIVAAALVEKATQCGVYNIGTGRTVSLDEFAEAVRRQLPRADFDIGPGLGPVKGGESRYSCMDIGRASAELGWKPSFSLDEAVAHYLSRVRELNA